MLECQKLRNVLWVLLGMASILMTQARAFAAPSNDNFANATTITSVSGSIMGTNVNSTGETGEPGSSTKRTVWYRWTAPASGGATFTVTGQVRLVCRIYTGSAVNALTERSYDDAGYGTTTYARTFNAISGTTYSVQVDDYGGDTGSFTLSWQPGPSNDNFAAAQAVSGISIDVSGTNVNSSSESGEPGSSTKRSVWYQWTAPASGGATFTVTGPARLLCRVYTGQAVNALTERSYTDTGYGSMTYSRTFNAVMGTSYSIQIDDYGGDTGVFSLYGGLAPTNDIFANALSIGGKSGRVFGINLPASSEPGEPAHAGISGGASVWYRWTAPATGYVTFNTDGTDFNTIMGVYTGTNVALLTTIGSDDNYDFGTNFAGTTINGSSAVRFRAVQGVAYSIAVDGLGGLTGHVVLSWTSSDRPVSLHGANQGDVLFQHQGSGAVYYYLMNGVAKASEGYIWTGGDPAWKLVGTPDINGDGQPDMVFQHSLTGAVYYYLMNGVNKAGEGYLWAGGDTNWKLVTFADLNNDGTDDLIFQYATTGKTYYYIMSGGVKVGEGTLWAGGDANWKLVASADLNFDGHPDFLFQNITTANGSLYYHLMNGVARIGEGYLWQGDDSSKRLVAIADMNGDGKPDLLLQNNATGEGLCFLLNGTSIFDARSLWAAGSPAWKLTGATDFNSDGRQDLEFRNTQTGAAYYYLMNGITKVGEGYLWAGGDPGWTLLPYRQN